MFESSVIKLMLEIIFFKKNLNGHISKGDKNVTKGTGIEPMSGVLFLTTGAIRVLGEYFSVHCTGKRQNLRYDHHDPGSIRVPVEIFFPRILIL